MAHLTVPAAEALLDRKIEVLNRGFVRLVDYMGSDARIVQSARVSYGEGTKTVRQDTALLRYLMAHDHLSPFEQVVFTFHLKMPIFVARQLVRHRTARMNEISGRYSQMKDEFYLPAESAVRKQSQRNRQGGSDEETPGALKSRVLDILKTSERSAYAGYQEMVEAGIARELARIGLPLSLYTEMYWQIDLRNLLNFLRLRLDWHAQYEIRVYAEAMAQVVQAVCPAVWEAFEEYTLKARKLYASEWVRVRELLAAHAPDLLREIEEKE